MATALTAALVICHAPICLSAALLYPWQRGLLIQNGIEPANVMPR